MKIVPYSNQYFDSCLTIFNSNVPTYFVDEEQQEFIDWLNKESEGQPYFVLTNNNEVIGCGGIYLAKDDYKKSDFKDEAGFAWGMIHSDFHKQGFGKQLSIFRLNYLKEHYPNRPIILRTTQFTYQFFEKLGFVNHEVLPNGFGDGMDKHTMVYSENETKTV